MPVIPQIQTLTGNSVDILNAIRNSATQNYRDYVPLATPNASSIRSIGNVLLNNPATMNEFLSALVNRIGLVIITSKNYMNPWAPFKKGTLELGETVEEVFVNIAKVQEFNPENAETNVFAREIPDVRAAFHIMNYQKQYKATISNDQLRQAFLSWQGITDLIARIVDSMYTGMNYDEFQTMKYMLAKHILNGQLYVDTVSSTSAENAPAIVTEIKGVSNLLTFMSTEYNMTGVHTFTPKDDQIIILNSRFDSIMDVNVLAAAFNIPYAQFMGQRVLVDSFGALDTERLNMLFGSDPDYEEISSGDLALLDAIPAVVVDRNFFMVFDNLQTFTENYNGEGLYWNYWLNAWKTFSVSPFSNAIVFNSVAPTVTNITISPAAVTVDKGQSASFQANVTTTGFAPMAVNWTINSELSTIDNSGNLKVSANETAGSITVTATSVFNPSVSGTATVTVPAE